MNMFKNNTSDMVGEGQNTVILLSDLYDIKIYL